MSSQPASALDYLTRAYRMLGLLDSADTMPADQADLGFDVLQDLVDGWVTDMGLLFTTPWTQVTLTANKASYSIGTGGDINIARPEYITGVGLILNTTQSPQQEVDLGRLLTYEDYLREPEKTIAANLPDRVYYDHNFDANGRGTIYVLPVPNVGTAALKFYVPQTIAQFPDLTTPVTLPPGFAKALRYNLALELSGTYNMEAPPGIVVLATKSLGQVKRSIATTRLNERIGQFPADLVDPTGSTYNIYSDT